MPQKSVTSQKLGLSKVRLSLCRLPAGRIEGPGLFQALPLYSRPTGARVARLRCPILLPGKEILSRQGWLGKCPMASPWRSERAPAGSPNALNASAAHPKRANPNPNLWDVTHYFALFELLSRRLGFEL